MFHNDLSAAPLRGSSPRHQAEVGGSPRLKRLRLIFLRSMPSPGSYNNRIVKVSRHQAEVWVFSPTKAIAPHI